MTGKLLINSWALLQYDLSLLIFERGGGTGVPGEKPSKHRRDQLRQLGSHEAQVQDLAGLYFFPVVRGNALTTCATQASQARNSAFT